MAARVGAARVYEGALQVADDQIVSRLPDRRELGAIMGHFLQQFVTAGLTAVGREIILMEGFAALVKASPWFSPQAQLGVQLVVSAGLVGQHRVRQRRLERLPADSTVAVRGFHGLSPDQWDPLPSDAHRERHMELERGSRRVTQNQWFAEGLYGLVSIIGLKHGDGMLPARVLATQCRNLSYAWTRESSNAAVSLAGPRAGVPTHGVNRQNMETLAWTYFGVTLAVLAGVHLLPNLLLPDGLSANGAVVNDRAGQLLTEGLGFHRAVALVAVVRGTGNWMIEGLDAYLSGRKDAQQAGTVQEFRFSMPNDFGRLADHSPARLSWNGLPSAVPLLLVVGELVAQDKLPPVLGAFLGVFGTAALLGMHHMDVNRMYQAHAKVRAAGDQPGLPVTAEP